MAVEDKPIVIVIDDTPLRRDHMAEAFKEIADVRVAYRDPADRKTNRQSATGENLDILGPALLILRHFRDRKVDPKIKTVLTVFYGGNGGSDRDRPEGDPEVIWRQVNAGSGTLTKDEAIELLAYARAIQRKVAHPAKPAFLTHAFDPVLLPALSILCQGYLAVYAEKTGGKWGPEAIRGALTHMKLPAFFDKSSGGMNPLLDSLPRKRDLVSSPEWWSKVMPKTKKEAEKRLAEELEIAALNERTPLGKLVAEIFGDNPITPSVVAEAYCAAATKLTGESCTHR
jgi:hypothetical protein